MSLAYARKREVLGPRDDDRTAEQLVGDLKAKLRGRMHMAVALVHAKAMVRAGTHFRKPARGRGDAPPRAV